jgi:hypothetical protein
VHPAVLALEHLGSRERLHEQEPHPRSQNPPARAQSTGAPYQVPWINPATPTTHQLRPLNLNVLSANPEPPERQGEAAIGPDRHRRGRGSAGESGGDRDGIWSGVGEGEGGRRGVGKAETTRKRNGNVESLPPWSFPDEWFFLRPEFIEWDDDGPCPWPFDAIANGLFGFGARHWFSRSLLCGSSWVRGSDRIGSRGSAVPLREGAPVEEKSPAERRERGRATGLLLKGLVSFAKNTS